MAKDVYYFPHEATAHSDPKITKLLMALKAEGYGIYWVIIEMLRNEESLMLTKNDYDAIAYQSHSDCMTVARVVEDFGLFSVSQGGSFCSESLIKRVELYREKSRKYSQNAHKKWSNHAMALQSHMQSHSHGNALKERKGKEIKLNKTAKSSLFVKDNPPCLSDVFTYCQERKNGIDAQSFIDKNEAVGWVDKNKVPYRDWKAVVRNWENYRKATATPSAPIAPAKRPVALMVIEKIAAGKSNHEIMHDLVGTYTEHSINEALMHARGNIQ